MIHVAGLRLALAFAIIALANTRMFVDADEVFGPWGPPLILAAGTIGALAALLIQSSGLRGFCWGAALLAPLIGLGISNPLVPDSPVLSLIPVLIGQALFGLCHSSLMAVETARALHSWPGRWGAIRAYGSLGAMLGTVVAAAGWPAYLAISTCCLALGYRQESVRIRLTRFPKFNAVSPVNCVPFAIASMVMAIVALPYQSMASVFFSNEWRGGEAVPAVGLIGELFLLGMLFDKLSTRGRKRLWCFTPIAWCIIYSALAIAEFSGVVAIGIPAIVMQALNCVFQAQAVRSAVHKESTLEESRRTQLILTLAQGIGNVVAASVITGTLAGAENPDDLLMLWTIAAFVAVASFPVALMTSGKIS